MAEQAFFKSRPAVSAASGQGAQRRAPGFFVSAEGGRQAFHRGLRSDAPVRISRRAALPCDGAQAPHAGDGMTHEERDTEPCVECGAQTKKTIVELEPMLDFLRRAYGVEALFVRVKSLSKIMGIPTATIYTALREGRFEIPHRVVGSAPVASALDLAEWLLRSVPETEAKRDREKRAVDEARGREAEVERAATSAPAAESARETRRRLIAEAMRALNGGGAK